MVGAAAHAAAAARGRRRTPAAAARYASSPLCSPANPIALIISERRLRTRQKMTPARLAMAPAPTWPRAPGLGWCACVVPGRAQELQRGAQWEEECWWVQSPRTTNNFPLSLAWACCRAIPHQNQTQRGARRCGADHMGADSEDDEPPPSLVPLAAVAADGGGGGGAAAAAAAGGAAAAGAAAEAAPPEPPPPPVPVSLITGYLGAGGWVGGRTACHPPPTPPTRVLQSCTRQARRRWSTTSSPPATAAAARCC